jgi:IPT/TIG domain
MSRWRRGQLEEPHAKALEALGRMQQSRRVAPGRGTYPNRPMRPGAYRTVPRRPSRRRSVGLLPWAVGVLIILNIVAGGVLALSLTNPNQKTPTAQGPQPSGTATPTSGQESHGTTSTTSAGHGGASSSTAPPSSSLPPSPGAGPVLAAISPASGVAGQVVTLTGTGLFSANGIITVTFGSAQASVVCSTETTCRATVPTRAPASSGTVSVTVQTESGTSNKVAFSYA